MFGRLSDMKFKRLAFWLLVVGSVSLVVGGVIALLSIDPSLWGIQIG